MKNLHSALILSLYSTIALALNSTSSNNASSTSASSNNASSTPASSNNASSNNDVTNVNSTGNSTRIPLIASHHSIYDHVDWGNTTSRLRNVDEYHPYVYFGHGSCPKKEQPFSKLQRAPTTALIIRFYINLMGLGCTKGSEEKIMNLFSKEFLRLDYDNTVLINDESGVYNSDKYVFSSKTNYFLAFQLHALSQIHVSLTHFPVTPNTPDGEPMTDEIFVTLNIFLAMIDAAKPIGAHVWSAFPTEYLNIAKYVLPQVIHTAETTFSFRRFNAFSRLRIRNTIIVLLVLDEFCRDIINAAETLVGPEFDAHDYFKEMYLRRKQYFVDDLPRRYPWMTQRKQ